MISSLTHMNIVIAHPVHGHSTGRENTIDMTPLARQIEFHEVRRVLLITAFHGCRNRRVASNRAARPASMLRDEAGCPSHHEVPEYRVVFIVGWD